MQQFRVLRLVGATGTIRTATFEDRNHIVVPVVALREAVIYPFGASGPELVPRDALALAPSGWDGRPCLVDHPQANGEMLSANSPTVLETRAFGRIFHTALDPQTRLLMEAYLDPAQAARVGPDAVRILERLQAGETVDVSVGAFVVAAQRTGEFNGRSYTAVWETIVPDHLAFLPEGTAGACSVEMGCGAPRSASAYLVTASGLMPVNASAHPCPACHGAGLNPERAMGDPQGQEPCGTCHGSGRLGASQHAILFRDGSWCVMSASGDKALSRHDTRASAVEWKRQRRMLAAESGEDGSIEEADERQAMTPRHMDWMDMMAPRSTTWEAPSLSDFTDKTWGDLTDAERRQIAAHFAHADEMPPASFGALKLPHHRSSDGQVVFRGVTAALGRLNQTDMSAEAKAAARRHLDSHREMFEAEEREAQVHDKLAAVFEGRAAQAPEDMSDEERRDLLGESLKRIEPQIVRVMSVTGQDEGMVVYLIDPDPGGPSPFRPYQRSFTIDAEGRTSFSDERVPVRPSTQWVPVVAKATGESAPPPCGCGTTTAVTPAAGGRTMERKDRIAALISDAGTPWSAADQTYLDSISDVRLTELETQAVATKQLAEAKTAAEQALATTKTELATLQAAQSRPRTLEQYLTCAPPEIKTIVARHQAAETAKRTVLVSALKGAQSAYSEDELKTLDLVTLEKIAAVAGIGDETGVDFGGMGTPRLAAETTDVEPPRSYDIALARRRGATGAAA